MTLSQDASALVLTCYGAKVGQSDVTHTNAGTDRVVGFVSVAGVADTTSIRLGESIWDTNGLGSAASPDGTMAFIGGMSTFQIEKKAAGLRIIPSLPATSSTAVSTSPPYPFDDADITFSTIIGSTLYVGVASNTA